MLIAVSVVALLWLGQLILALRARAAVPRVDLLPPPADRSALPTVSVVVPARNEGPHIEAALRSRLSCGYPSLQLVAVDDRSSDETGAAMRRAASSDPRVTVVRIDQLPQGWLGKLNAMARGAERATGDWVLFSDADVHLAEGALERIVAYAEAERADFVAIFPKLDPVNPVLDAFVVSLLRTMLMMGRVWRANDDGAPVGVGVGAFNLVRRRLLESTGALAELRMEIADDVALGSLMKQRGARCRFLAGREQVHLTFLPNLGAAARSADKGGGTLGFTLWAPLLFAGVPALLDVVIPFAALTAGGLTSWVGVVALALIAATHALLADWFRAPLRGVLLLPLGALLTSALMLRSGLLAWWRGGVYWRDTFYSKDAIVAGRRLTLSGVKAPRR